MHASGVELKTVAGVAHGVWPICVAYLERQRRCTHVSCALHRWSALHGQLSVPGSVFEAHVSGLTQRCARATRATAALVVARAQTTGARFAQAGESTRTGAIGSGSASQIGAAPIARAT